MDDKFYMRQALRLARKGLGWVSPNPMVGAVIVKDGKVFVQAGAGIVYDSVPENEYQETINKAAALFKAVKLLR